VSRDAGENPPALARPPGAPHIMPMESLLVLMIAGATAFSFWNASRAANERAVALGRNACRAAGVQLLDQTVHASGLRLRRRGDGRLGLERSFRFEYSHDGSDRHVGRLVLVGGTLVGFSGPVRASGGLPRAEARDPVRPDL
jgi:hypothetical protein